MGINETRGFGGPPGGANFLQRFDQDGNGSLSKSELDKFAQELSRRTGKNITADQILQRQDANGDGSLSNEEMRPPGPRPGADSSFLRGGGRQNPFARFDADGNGTLSREELTAMASDISQHTGQTVSVDDLLARIDGNGDGQVTNDELKAGRDQMRNEVEGRLSQLRMRRM